MPAGSNSTPSERAMLAAERRFPELAERSGKKAYQASLNATGAVVVKLSNGKVVERRADGSTKLIKTLPVGKKVKVGQVLTRKNSKSPTTG